MSVNETQPMEALPGERGMPAIGEPVGGNLAARKRIAAFVAMGFLLAAGAFFLWKGRNEAEREEKKETQAFASPAPAKTFGNPPTPKLPKESSLLVPYTAPTAPPTVQAPAPLLMEEAPKPQPRASGGGSGRRTPTLDKGQSALMVGGGSSTAVPSAPQASSLDSYMASLQGLSTAPVSSPPKRLPLGRKRRRFKRPFWGTATSYSRRGASSTACFRLALIRRCQE